MKLYTVDVNIFLFPVSWFIIIIMIIIFPL